MVDNKKEVEPRVTSVEGMTPSVEVPVKPEENLEVEGWMEKIEKRFGRVPNATTDVTDDAIIVSEPQAQQPPVTLPVNQKQIVVGKKAKPELSIAWLVTWALRQIKMMTKRGKNVRLQDIPEVK